MMERAEQEMEGLAFGGQVKIEKEAKSKKSNGKAINQEGVVDEVLPAGDSIMSNLKDSVVPSEIEYKILIKNTTYALPKDSELYDTHRDLIEVESGSGYKYLIGSFSELKDVQNFMTNTVKLIYPKAEIVKFSDGKILN